MLRFRTLFVAGICAGLLGLALVVPKVSTAVPPSSTTLELTVVADDDDAEEFGSGGVTLDSTDLDLGGPLVGLRFPSFGVPPGASVSSALIQFTVDETGSSSTELTIEAEASPDAAPFLGSSFNLSSRPRTAADVAWSPQNWNKVGDAGNRQQTPELAALIQEVISAPDWEWNNALALFLDGSGARVAESADAPSGAPVLHVEFSFDGNVVPRVRIQAPLSGTVVEMNDSLALAGTALDAEDGDLGASLQWSSDLDGSLGSGAALVVTNLSPGLHVITASALDSGGATGTATTGVMVLANTPPVVSLLQPADGASFVVGTSVSFLASANDFEDGDLSGDIDWSSSLDGWLGQGPSIVRADLSPGMHLITASVLDSSGLSADEMRNITIEDTSSPVVLAAGDIARCSSTGDEQTAALLDGLSGTVVTLGDNVYPDGTADEYADCYDPSWGRHLARTRPAPGNHEYHTPDATGYYGYYGAAAGDPTEGWYSFDLGSWHVVVLNSNCSEVGGCGFGSAQAVWLAADLVANPRDCTLAIWHHPRFSSGTHGDSTRTADLWELLHWDWADVALVGHDHDYERFALQDADGNAAPGRGLRQFVVGTGGAGLRDFGTIAPNSEIRDSDNHGVLKLTLHPTSYDWEFVSVPGGTGFQDSGSASCVVENSGGGGSSCGLGGELLLILPVLAGWARRRSRRARRAAAA